MEEQLNIWILKISVLILVSIIGAKIGIWLSFRSLPSFPKRSLKKAKKEGFSVPPKLNDIPGKHHLTFGANSGRCYAGENNVNVGTGDYIGKDYEIR